jgi:chromosome segregation ATPase
MNKDMQEIYCLLDIMRKTVDVPKLKGLHDWAETELVAIQQDYPSHNELKAQVSSLTGNLTAQKSQTASLKSQIESLQEKLATVEAEKAKLEEDMRTPAPVPTIEGESNANA